MNWFVEVYGWIGAALLLLAYCLHSLSGLPPRRLYHGLNFLGAGGIVLCSFAKHSYQPALLNTIWMAEALAALIQQLKAKQSVHR